jgi:hypothetical protein
MGERGAKMMGATVDGDTHRRDTLVGAGSIAPL